MRRRAIALVLILFLVTLFLFGPAVEAAPCELTRGEPLLAGDVKDAQSLTLADGREVKLAGIDIPKHDVAKGGAPRVEEQLDAVLAGLLVQDATLAYDQTREDRYGRVLAFPLAADGRSVQSHLVEAGLARVRSSADNRNCIAELLALEEEARAGRRGIWRDPAYAIVAADDVAALLRAEGEFAIVEGVVHEAASVRGRLYFNFGEDRRTDFTVTVAPADAKLFKAGDWTSIRRDPRLAAGRKMRVRGFIESYNGPEITLTHPEQVEFSSEDKARANEGVDGVGKRKKRKP